VRDDPIIDVITIRRIASTSITTTTLNISLPPPTKCAIAAPTPEPSMMSGLSMPARPSEPWNAIGTAMNMNRHSTPDQKMALNTSFCGSLNSRV